MRHHDHRNRVPRYCPVCEQPMDRAVGCQDRRIQFADGETLAPIPYGEEQSHGWAAFDERPVTGCDGCSAAPGEPHHPGCPVEDCPLCRDQYITCDCQTLEKVKLAESGLLDQR